MLLSQDPSVALHIPKTSSLSFKNLTYLLKWFPILYIKPNDSYQGKGILRIDQNNDGLYTLKTNDGKKTFYHDNVYSLMRDIIRLKNKRPYIIQQGILSETMYDQLFDLRVHMLRIDGQWIIGGIVVRLASAESVVTNAYSGGQSIFLNDLFYYRHTNYYEQDNIRRALYILSMKITNIISMQYPKWSEFGLDLGLDWNNHLWLYEVNILPGGLVFKNLDSEIYKNLLHLRKIATR